MAASEQIGIKGLHSFHYYVHDFERSREFYEDRFGWVATHRSGDALSERSGQHCTVFQAGGVRAAVSVPQGIGSPRSARWLKRHPDGIGSLTFEVEDAQKAWDFLTARDATPITRLETFAASDGGQFRQFLITTAIGDVAFRFVERRDTAQFAPGFEALQDESAAQGLGFRRVDHVTCNAQTMASVKLWLEHVLGMEQCWEIEFHTEDVAREEARDFGTGLRSVVMWDPRSGLKFPINEPLAPFFKDGQINRFIEDNAGAGVQHVALEVDDIVHSVERLRQRGVRFLETPKVYYEMAAPRLREQGVEPSELAHSLELLEPLGILIDGSPVNNYLIQIFLEDAMTLYDEPSAGPFFYELIQRCGDQGFGGGNFRALFEAIERAQIAETRAA